MLECLGFSVPLETQREANKVKESVENDFIDHELHHNNNGFGVVHMDGIEDLHGDVGMNTKAQTITEEATTVLHETDKVSRRSYAVMITKSNVGKDNQLSQWCIRVTRQLDKLKPPNCEPSVSVVFAWLEKCTTNKGDSNQVMADKSLNASKLVDFVVLENENLTHPL
ncbi:hypothetical protein V6N13_037528 [Hibiscus sabdariffa]|uniref:Uncharacterized protein n=1 Tax=Hibiscus sabdariffa TaxID=183260 RepID=A0ABR2S5Q1_9ROSI